MGKLWLVFIVIMGLSLTFVSCDDSGENADTPDATEDGDAETDDSDDVTEEDDVKVLTSANFDSVINSNDIILVEFYAPWCGHCKSLAPKYAKAATTLKENDPPVALAKVDATEHSELATRFDISGYPTLKYFLKGVVYEYDGGREEDTIVAFMKERADPDWKPPPAAVITLTKDNFNDVINREELILVEFYAPWCGHCKKLAPDYEKAAKALKENDPPILLAKVDATQESEIASRYDVTGYPTLKIFRKGRPQEFKGETTEYGIQSYMSGQQGEAARELTSDKEVRAFMPVDDITTIGFFDTEDDPRLRIYKDAANEMRDDYTFGYTLAKDARRRYKVNSGAIVVFNAERYYTKYEPKWSVIDKEEITASDVTKFVDEHKLPLVGTYESKTEARYGSRKPLCLVFYSVDWSFEYRDATQIWRQKIVDIAKDYKGDIHFAIADEESYNSMIKDFKFDDSGEEMNIGILDDKGKKYAMEPMEDFDPEEIREFINNYKKGKIPAITKSQPVPKKQGLVTTVVGKNFDNIVLDSNKDVLIEFYAPWCGHCKSLEPKYKELAKKYKSNKNIVIAKMDATANDVPEDFAVKGFPTIYFSAAGNSKPKMYEGGREVDDFVKYLEENASSLGTKVKEEL